MNKFKYSIVFFAYSISFLFIESAFSDELMSSSEDLRIAKIARERLYPGGQDEEDLELQVQIIRPIRKQFNEIDKNDSHSNDDEF